MMCVNLTLILLPTHPERFLSDIYTISHTFPLGKSEANCISLQIRQLVFICSFQESTMVNVMLQLAHNYTLSNAILAYVLEIQEQKICRK